MLDPSALPSASPFTELFSNSAEGAHNAGVLQGFDRKAVNCTQRYRRQSVLFRRLFSEAVNHRALVHSFCSE